MSKDITMLYREHGFTPKPKTHNELCGPCPWCGGKDRFTIFTGQGHDGLGRFWCRQCGKSGDAIQFLRDLEGLGFKEAKRALGLPDSPHRHRRQPTRAETPPPEFTPPKMVIPGPVWLERSIKIVSWACGQLRQAHEVQEWLARDRGLTLATVTAARLGWIPKDYFRPREAFGLPEEFKDNGKPRRVWIPHGLCIPVFHSDGGLLRVKFRVADPGPARPKYIPLPQAEKNTAPLVLKSSSGASPWQVVESELDALLLAQEAGHLVNVVAMGSAAFRPDAVTWAGLRAAPLVLVSLDFDEAGNKAACQWWETHLPPGRYRLWPVPEGKDPCDAWKARWDLAEWTKSGLEAEAL
ncbi:toprim domain-containing protein [Desulfovibrio sp. OttesenSCG-928-O18]|nr:toprim domain-containing protein [Desulfovibrio sp. OttesenSCG-928-O18]